MISSDENLPPIKSVAELGSALAKLEVAVKTHAHWRSWFRGHSRTGWPLKPGVYRPTFGQPLNERDRLYIEQHLNQEFTVMSAGLRTGRESVEEIYFLQQHYRMPTRLLDWTTSALAALYFSCCGDPDVDGDGELFLMDAYKFRFPNSVPKSRRGVATSRHPEVGDAIRVISEWKDETRFPDYIIPVRPDSFERRVALQRSCFTFHVPNHQALTKAENPTLRNLRIPANSKKPILLELRLLGIDHFPIFGDLEHLARFLKEAHNVT